MLLYCPSKWPSCHWIADDTKDKYLPYLPFPIQNHGVRGGFLSLHALDGKQKRFSDIKIIALTFIVDTAGCRGGKGKTCCQGPHWDTVAVPSTHAHTHTHISVISSVCVNNVIFVWLSV